MSRKTLKNIAKGDINKRTALYMKDNTKLLQKYGLGFRVVIHFPNKQKLSFLAKLAVKLLANQGGLPDIQFNNLTPQNKR